MQVAFRLNGKPVSMDVSPATTVMDYLRREGLFSVKTGCDHGECGSCSILVDGRAMNACLMLMHSIAGKEVETLEGLQDQTVTQQLQSDFIEQGAIQCGYCTPGMLVALTGLSREQINFDEAAVTDALAGNLCRCTGYKKPVEASLKSLKAEH